MPVNPTRPQGLRVRLPAVALVLLTTGCGILQPKAFISPLGEDPDHHVITKTASLSTTLVVPRGTRYFLCASPPPDASFSQGQTVGLSISMLNFGRGSEDSVSETSAEQGLMGRTPAVVLARELLYRFCEFQLNQQLTREQAIDLYGRNLSIIRDIAMQESANTRVTIGESQAVESVQSSTGAAALPPPRVPVAADPNAMPQAVDPQADPNLSRDGTRTQ
jgi:hypothetical protein